MPKKNGTGKKASLFSLPIFVLSITVLTTCGGQGGGGATPQPATAVLTLSTAVTGTIPAGTTINGYAVTITLPAGVTVKTILNSSETGTDVVAASGNASDAITIGVYTAATGTFPATVKVYLAGATGFDAGEFCKVTCDFTTDHPPTAADFTPPMLNEATGWDSSTNSSVLNMHTRFGMSVGAAVSVQ